MHLQLLVPVVLAAGQFLVGNAITGAVVNIEAIIWYAVLLDSIGANIAVWFFPSCVKWYKKKMPRFSKFLPLTKGWALVYLAFTIWVGSALARLGVLFW